jgi:hypothetical protein
MPADGTSAIADAVLAFVSQIDGLHTTLPLAMMVIQGQPAPRTRPTNLLWMNIARKRKRMGANLSWSHLITNTALPR